MANQNTIMKQGIVMSVVVDSILNREAFSDGKAKKMYISLLASCVERHPSIKLLSYAILSDSAYLLLYSSDEKLIDTFMISLNETYGAYYNDRYDYNGYIFKLPNLKNKIKYDDIIPAIAHIHKLPEYNGLTNSYKNYRYSSCVYIFRGKGITDKQFLLQLFNIQKLDGVTYTAWHKQGLKSKVGESRKGKEKYSKAIETANLRYRGLNLKTNEDVIKQIAMDVSERCNIPYKKLSKKLGIKNRRDILIEIIASLIFDRGYTFLDAIDVLQASEYGVYTLLLEVIISVNERNHFGYDYIINSIQVEDSNYTILEEVIKSLNRVHGLGFVEIAKKFSLQNNIIELRMRTGV